MNEMPEPMSFVRRPVGLLVLASALAAAAPLAHAAATVHQRLLASSPADGETLEPPPGEARLTFYEPVQIRFTELELAGPDGAVALPAAPRVHADSPTVAIQDLPALPPGGYLLTWRTASADGHPVRGTISFTVLPPPEPAVAEPADPLPPPPPPPPPAAPDAVFDAASPAYVAVRWLTFMGIVGVIGALVFRALVLELLNRGRSADGAALVPASARAAASFGLAAAAVLILAGLARLAAQVYALYGELAFDGARLTPILTGTVWGWGWNLQIAAAAVALVGFALARGRSVGWILAAAAAAGVAFTPGLSGHAVASADLTALAVLFDAVHVAAAAGWIGGLILVLLVGVPVALREGGERRGAAVSALVNAFSPTALAFAAAVVATGIFATWLHLGHVSALWTTEYGRTLLLKIAALAVLFGLGAYNYLRVRPALAGDGGTVQRLRRSAGLEVAVALVVLLVTAVLVATPPPAEMPAPAADGAREAGAGAAAGQP